MTHNYNDNEYDDVIGATIEIFGKICVLVILATALTVAYLIFHNEINLFLLLVLQFSQKNEDIIISLIAFVLVLAIIWTITSNDEIFEIVFGKDKTITRIPNKPPESLGWIKNPQELPADYLFHNYNYTQKKLI